MQCSISLFLSISSSSSTRSDVQSAPLELTQLFAGICKNSTQLLSLRGRQLPPKWNIADLIQVVMEIRLSEFQDTSKITIMISLRESLSCLVEDFSNFLDLIHSVLQYGGTWWIFALLLFLFYNGGSMLNKVLQCWSDELQKNLT